MDANEIAINYIIQDEKSLFLYGTDTKGYNEQSINYLKELTINTFILDANDGPIEKKRSNHNRFKDIKKVPYNVNWDNNKTIYLTHISHEANLLHNALEMSAIAHIGNNVKIVYDGYRFATI